MYETLYGRANLYRSRDRLPTPGLRNQPVQSRESLRFIVGICFMLLPNEQPVLCVRVIARESAVYAWPSHFLGAVSHSSIHILSINAGSPSIAYIRISFVWRNDGISNNSCVVVSTRSSSLSGYRNRVRNSEISKVEEQNQVFVVYALIYWAASINHIDRRIKSYFGFVFSSIRMWILFLVRVSSLKLIKCISWKKNFSSQKQLTLRILSKKHRRH